MLTPRFDSLPAWLSWMESLHPTEIELGLTRVSEVAERLGLLKPKAKIITIAGTNGKGSCVEALSKLLRADGKNVGAFTSPHISEYNERISVNGKLATDREICNAFAAIDHARGAISLTYFEFGTLAAFCVFQQRGLDYWLLEVGLGGRLDAVNILNADIAILSSVDLDHEAWLGSDRESIGREKAGVLRPGIPFVCAESDVPDSVQEHAKLLQCQTYYLSRDFSVELRGSGLVFNLCLPEQKSERVTIERYQLPPTSLAAAAQAYSILTGVLPRSDLLSAASLPGRFERQVSGELECILDVAHNPHAASLLSSRLKQEMDHPIPAIFACMSDKNISGIVEKLKPQVSQWLCCDLASNPRAASADTLLSTVQELGVSGLAVSSLADGLQELRQAEYSGSVLIFGTFFIISEFKEIIANTL